MRWIVTLAGPDRPGESLVLEAEPDTPASDAAAALRSAAGLPAGEALYLDGAELDGPTGIGESGLRDGSVIRWGWVPASGHQEPAGGWELAVVSGPRAGDRVPLGPPGAAPVTVGRDPSCDLVLDDPSVSRRHCRVGADPAGAWLVEDLGSRNGTRVAGAPVAEGSALPVREGDPLTVGAFVLEVRRAPAADADVHPDGRGGLLFNRPARIEPAPREVEIDVPDQPREQEQRHLPWLQGLAPAVIGLVLYLVLHSVTMLLFLVLSPVVFLTGVLGEHRRARRKAEKTEADYRQRLGEAEARAAAAAQAEALAERRRWPDPAWTAATAAGPGRRLWERRPGDDDFAVLRAGLARRPARMVIQGPGLDVPELPAAPVAVDVRAAGVVGVAGPLPAARAVARWLVLQLAVWHPPTALQLVVLTADDDASAGWDWVRWLPHARRADPGGPLAAVGNDADTCDDRVRELLALLDERVAAAPGGLTGRLNAPAARLPYVVVVLDGARELRAVPGLGRLLAEGPAHGIWAVALDRDGTRLPEEAGAELELDRSGGPSATLRVRARDPRPDVLVDGVEPALCEVVARALAPLRDSGREVAGVSLPPAVRLLDVLGVDPDRPEQVADAWRRSGRSPRGVVGVSADGPFAIDLRRDGPHGLVAGTTGSGKSEFLQTLVASLAVVNRPEAMQFVLVDYKGASAFADCAELPHTVGMVTNLDAAETRRALEALDAELRRREEMLREMRVPDADAAWEADPGGAAARRLGRLVIVIDEFAELSSELPDFVSGLVRIARVGRSLGVHLILATQRPAGVVTGEIRANTGLRVALRVEDPADSTEVLDVPDAARIARSSPGRAFARVAGAAGVTEFQTARVAGRRPGEAAGRPAPRVLRVPWERLGRRLPPPPAADEAVGTGTDLHALVAALRAAADQLGGPAPVSPWLPPLPDLVGTAALAGNLAGAGAAAEGVAAGVAFALEDRPTQQAQVPLRYDIEHHGHMAVIGAARSGRSSLLRTVAAGLASAWAPSDLHLYGFDFGNGALMPLAALPHTGAVARRSEPDRIDRLLGRLLADLDRRQELLAGSGYGDVAEQRAKAAVPDRLAWSLVLVDRWEGSSAGAGTEAGEAFNQGLGRLVREGDALGFRVLVSGDRALLTDRLVASIADRLILRLNDREDYRTAGLDPRRVDGDAPPGRAWRSTTLTAVQAAVLSRPGRPVDASAAAQAEEVAAVAAEAARRGPPGRPAPIRVATLPASVSLAALGPDLDGGAKPEAAAGGWRFPLGLGGDDASVRWVDLGARGGFVVAGPPRSGRSTALSVPATWAVAHDLAAVGVALRPSPLTSVAGLPVVTDGSKAAGEELVGRLGSMPGPTALLVDDADAFSRTDAEEELRMWMRSAGPGRLLIVVAGAVDDLRANMRGVVGEARRAGCGLLLSPSSPYDGELLGARLARAFLERMPPGRGCLVADGVPELVQVARPAAPA